MNWREVPTKKEEKFKEKRKIKELGIGEGKNGKRERTF